MVIAIRGKSSTFYFPKQVAQGQRAAGLPALSSLKKCVNSRRLRHKFPAAGY